MLMQSLCDDTAPPFRPGLYGGMGLCAAERARCGDGADDLHAGMVSPLTNLVEEDPKFGWLEMCEQAF